jgi:predicted amidohydrolase
MRVLLAAMQCHKGEPARNLQHHCEILEEARRSGARIAVFPEMSLSGSVDPASRPEHLLAVTDPVVERLAAATAETSVAAVFGIAERAADGRPFITQLYADGGVVRGVYRKRHLGEGEEAFCSGADSALFDLDGTPFGIAICAESGVDFPFDEPAAAGAPLVFFCAAPGLYGRRTDLASWQSGFDWWTGCGLADARRHAERLGIWIAMATQAGALVDEDMPGLAALVTPSGEVAVQLPDWLPATLVVDIPL